jgi:CBS-domain-containing membrane protein
VKQRVERVFEKIVTPAKTGVLNISPLEIVAAGLTIGLLFWLNDAVATSKIPLIIPSFAASVGVLYTQPGMSNARSWNVIAGQFFGALAGFICASIFTGSLPLAVGCAVGLALLFQRTTHSLHPPALATALIVVITPDAHGAMFLVRPVLAGSIIIVVIAWIVHLFEITALAHLKLMVTPPKEGEPSVT